jgi:ribonuclease BN (tRNA processing enzyme)/isopentenyl phosphate kinase
MQNDNVTLIKLGGSLITYKEDKQRIKDYSSIFDKFRNGEASTKELTVVISDLLNKQKIKEVFRTLKIYLQMNPSSRIVIVHGAGSIGHALVLHLLQNNENLEENYSLVKLAVSIQNQLIVASAIQSGINAISCSNHQIMLGYSTPKTSTLRIDASDLTVLETLIQETDAIPIFYGDVGFTHQAKQEKSGGWKVFSGDLIPNALIRRFSFLHINKAIFLTHVEGRKTGIYSTDPINPEAELITRISVSSQKIEYFNEKNERIKFLSGSEKSNFDIMDAMEGKLRNIVDLARSHTMSYVIGVEDLLKALNGENVGTVITPAEKQELSITFLGKGDAFSSGGFKSSGSLIDLPTKTILLDCGPHTLQALKAFGRETIEIDWILITHFHGDHFGGIPFILLESVFQHYRTKPLTIIGPPGIKSKVDELFSVLYSNEASKPLSFPCIYHEIIPDKSYEENTISIDAYSVNHSPEAQGYRIEFKSKVIAYTGDTGWTENLIPLIKDAHLAILECNFFESQFETHLNWQEIQKLISYPKKIAIIHFGKEMIRESYSLISDSDVIIPLEGQIIRL